jgi:hypothetical protein
VKVQLIRTPHGFIPATEHDTECLRGVKMGQSIAGDFRRPRNPQHHRKAFALLHAMYENQEQFDSFDRFYDWVKVRAGLVDLVEINSTGAVYRLRSMSFASMGQEEFEGVYQKIVTVAYEQMGFEWVLAEYG